MFKIPAHNLRVENIKARHAGFYLHHMRAKLATRPSLWARVLAWLNEAV